MNIQSQCHIDQPNKYDLMIFQMSLLILEVVIRHPKKVRDSILTLISQAFCGPYRIRTDDLLIANNAPEVKSVKYVEING